MNGLFQLYWLFLADCLLTYFIVVFFNNPPI
jgi:hypothetical protein